MKLLTKYWKKFIETSLTAKLFAIALLLLLVFTRYYNLGKTARFIWDESSDLVRMNEIWLTKNITMLGPISEDGEKVFGSLSYYMLLPFAVSGRFDPVSPVWGAAFWGMLTSLILLAISYKQNKKLIILIAVLAVVWKPLLVTSRWAWNPNLIPFWIALGILFFQKKNKLSLLLSGLFLGLTIHHHYLSIFAVGTFSLLVLIKYIRTRKQYNYYYFGLILSLTPFVLFDLTHPPGLFISRLLFFNHISSQISLNLFFPKVWRVYSDFFAYISSQSFSAILLALVSTLIFLDIKSKRNLIYLIPWLAQIIFLVLVSPIYEHYYVPALVFFLVWLIQIRKGVKKILTNLIIILLIFSSFTSIKNTLTQTSWDTNIDATREITNNIDEYTKDYDLKNVNIAVLASPDPNTYGRRYRDLLHLTGVKILQRSDYYITDNLFVISSSNEDEVRNDPAYELDRFRSGLLVESWNITDSIWNIYLFERSI